jgi:hypothetical protein
MDGTKPGNVPSLTETLPRFESPLSLWIAIWQRQLVNARG